jgi:dihydrofolate reductase
MNKVFIATSLDGYIADKNGGIDWLHNIPNPDKLDMGYSNFMQGIDAIVMGRNTFETICGFDIEWPYTVPVFVLSNSLNNIPEKFKNKAEIIKGDLPKIIREIHTKGYQNLYIDGGKTIQSFLDQNLINEIIVTIIPIILGDGIPLFNKINKTITFKCIHTLLFSNHIVQNHFVLVESNI